MRPETPRDPDGEPLCSWCGGPVRQPATGRRRDYCRRSCRQRAYEERQTAARIAAALATDSESSRDGTVPAAAPLPPVRRGRRRSTTPTLPLPLWED